MSGEVNSSPMQSGGAVGTVPQSLRDALAESYVLERELGRGGMATVYLARDVKHRRSVAVKVLRPDLTIHLGAARFLKEIEIAAALNHPHILALHDSGEADGTLYYVMPYVEGPSLRAVLMKETPLRTPAALEVVGEVADALSYAHRCGVVHRDIKPENVLLSDGHAVVADFGIAKAISTAGIGGMTRTGFPIGTPGYMSPEQAAGATDLDIRTDIYSLACVFYEMVIGDVPGMWVSSEAARLQRFVDASAAHRERLDLLPGSLEQVLVKAMDMKREGRFASARLFATALRESLGAKPRYAGSEVDAVLSRAAEIQANRYTDEPALSIGGIQRIAAEVDIPPSDVAAAVRDLQQPPAKVGRSGFFAVQSSLNIQRAVNREVTPDEYEQLLAEVRGAMSEVGRLNQTLGKSLSWNSLSFQNSVSGGGRLTHVMITPKDGSTTVRVTEASGQHEVVMGVVIGLATVMATVIVGERISTLAAPVVAVGSFGGLYGLARVWYKRFVDKRAAFLNRLADRLAEIIGRSQRPE